MSPGGPWEVPGRPQGFPGRRLGVPGGSLGVPGTPKAPPGTSLEASVGAMSPLKNIEKTRYRADLNDSWDALGAPWGAWVAPGGSLEPL